MSNTNKIPTKTSRRGFKVHYQEYLKNRGEPKEESHYDQASAELDAGLIKSSYYERRRLRRTANRLRRYAI